MCDVDVAPLERDGPGLVADAEVVEVLREADEAQDVDRGLVPAAGVVERARWVGGVRAEGQDQAEGVLLPALFDGAEEDGDEGAGVDLEGLDVGVDAERRDGEGWDGALGRYQRRRLRRAKRVRTD